jgi:Alpha-L-arabinofuranosidase B, catalytic
LIMRRLFLFTLACSIPFTSAGEVKANMLQAVTVNPVASGTLPCDIYAAGGTPCVAAHNVIHPQINTYTGPLFQARILGTTNVLDIGTVDSNAGKVVDKASLIAFCGSNYTTTCVYQKIYDHIGNQVFVPQFGNTTNLDCAGQPNFVSFSVPHGTLPIMHCGRLVAGARGGQPGNPALPTGNASVSVYSDIARAEGLDATNVVSFIRKRAA